MNPQLSLISLTPFTLYCKAHVAAALLILLMIARGLLLLVSVLHRRWAVQPEVTRKLVHAVLGVVLCAAPWIFTSAWPLALLCTIFLGMLLARPRLRVLNPPAAQLIFAVGRRTRGEMFFPVSVAVLFVLAQGQPLLFCIPMLVLALADGAAAVVGLRYGSGRRKSLEGSLAFAITAFLAIHLTLLLATDMARPATILIAVNLAAALAGIEAMCSGGWDNLLIPLGGYFLLGALLPLSAANLALCLIPNTLAVLLLAQRWPLFLALAKLTAPRAARAAQRSRQIKWRPHAPTSHAP